MRGFYNKALILLFLTSGVASLIFETIWVRVLSLSIGSTSASIGTVLAIFFTGLSLGSYLSGRYVHKIKNLLVTYAVIEAAIGIYGLAVLYPLSELYQILAFLPLDGSHSVFGTLAKFGLVFILLIAPSVGMGATLPLLVRYFVPSQENAGRSVALLYGFNTLGAVLGAFLTGFFLIPALGVEGTSLFAGSLYLGVALIVAFLAWRLPSNFKVSMESTREAPPTMAATVRRSFLSPNLILAALFICGFSSIAAEVVWSKYLGIFFGTNIFGLGLVLSLFLFGIAVGSFFCSFWLDKIKKLESLFTFLVLLSGIGTLVVSHLLSQAPIVVALFDVFFSGSINLLAIKSVVAGVFLFPATVLYGILFPTGVKLLDSFQERTEKSVGIAYSINTVGSILASCLTGLVIVPYFGSSVAIGVSATMLLGLGVICAVYVQPKKSLIILNGAAASAGLVILISSNSISFSNIIKSAYLQSQASTLSVQDVIARYQPESEVFKKIIEGRTAVISVSNDPQDGDNYKNILRLKTNGLNESIYPLENLNVLPKYEAMLGMLPYLTSSKADRAFIVGYGGGYTVDFLSSTDIREVDVVELEQGIIDAADYVFQDNNPILKRPSVRLDVEDARFILATNQREKYDIIVSQPSHSWLSGVANLFTKDFFEIVKGNLTEGGVYGQWLNLYNIDVTVIKSILRSFYEIFPHGAVFTDPNDQELIMIGSLAPIKLNMDRLDNLYASQQMRAKLANVLINDPYDAVTSFAFDRQTIWPTIEHARINTDLNAFAEVHQSGLFYRSSNLSHSIKEFFQDHYTGSELALKKSLGISEIKTDRHLQSLLSQSRFTRYHQALEALENKLDLDDNAQKTLADSLYMASRFATADMLYRDILKQAPSSDRLDATLGNLIAMYDFNSVIEIGAAYKMHQTTLSQCYLVESYLHQGMIDVAKEVFSELQKESSLGVCGSYYDKVAGIYHYFTGSYRQAAEHLENYYAADSEDITTIKKLAATYIYLENWERGVEFASYLRDVKAQKQKKLTDLSTYYLSQKNYADADVLKTMAWSF